MNQHFNQRFTEFVNNYRIHYTNKKIKEGQLGHFTLESLLEKPGFHLRRLSIKRLKKVNNGIPSEYITLLLSRPY
jgi:YesN/AraC family two-component response regulator